MVLADTGGSTIRRRQTQFPGLRQRRVNSACYPGPQVTADCGAHTSSEVRMTNVTSRPRACATPAAQHMREVIAPRPPNRWQAAGRGDARLLLLFATMALGLGLAVVPASFVPFADQTRYPPLHRSRGLGVRAPDPLPPHQIEEHNQARSLPWGQTGAPRPTTHRCGKHGDPSASPAYLPSAGTMWEQIRDSSLRDRRAFLLGTSIQVHAPETATTPGPRRVLPSKEG